MPDWQQAAVSEGVLELRLLLWGNCCGKVRNSKLASAQTLDFES